MKATGIVRHVDGLGRVVLPMEQRRTFQIDEGDPLEIYIEDDCIILKKYRPGCCICGEVENLLHIGNMSICCKCAENLGRKAAEHDK